MPGSFFSTFSMKVMEAAICWALVVLSSARATPRAISELMSSRRLRLSSSRRKVRQPLFWLSISSSKLNSRVMLFSHPSSPSIYSTRFTRLRNLRRSARFSQRSDPRNQTQLALRSLKAARMRSSSCFCSLLCAPCICGYQVKSMKVWLDCDPGHDDMLAIIMAAYSQNLHLLGVSTSSGNSTIENTTRNALDILHEIGREDIPVVKGAPEPLCRPLKTAPAIHGESGLEGAPLARSPREPITEKPFLHIYQQIMAQAEPVEFVVTGALTNLAIILRAFPDIKPRLRGVTLMGGAIGLGNCSPSAEFNILVDPEAAAIVFGSGLGITMIPLQVTHTVEVTEEVFAELGKLTSSFGQKLTPLFRYFQKKYKEDQEFEFPVAHDPCTIHYLLHPADFLSRPALVEIELAGKSVGRTNCHFLHHVPNATVCHKINVPNFWKAMLDCLRRIK